MEFFLVKYFMDINFRYLSSLSKIKLRKLEDLFLDERLLRHLWIEFLFNPEIIEIMRPYLNKPEVKDALEDALSWYLAFRWLLPENKSLEQLYKEQKVIPYRVKLKVYREKKREFIKGLIHAGLC